MAIIARTSEHQFTFENEAGKTLLELIQKKGIPINASCGGKGTCGRCAVHLKEGVFAINNKTIHGSSQSSVCSLACNTTVLHNHAIVDIPATSLINGTGKIVDAFEETHLLSHQNNTPFMKKILLRLPLPVFDDHVSDQQRLIQALKIKWHQQSVAMPLSVLKKLPEAAISREGQITVLIGLFDNIVQIIDIVPGEVHTPLYGLAFDIGTTTVAGWLIHLESGEILSKASLYNQQITLAEDVISRISLIQAEKDIKALQNLIVKKTIHPVLSALCSEAFIKPSEVVCAAFSANTVMMHLLLGLDPRGMGKAPFNPVIRSYDRLQACEIGLPIHKNGLVTVMPAASAYIGGDIVSDIYVSAFNKAAGLRMLIDIGTNGEIVLSDNGHMVACSTAAGPAFEGYGLYHGCRAGQGAVERIAFDQQNALTISVIGGGKASGICGSAIIDFIAVALQKGIILPNGRFDILLLKKTEMFYELKHNGKKMNACIIADRTRSALDEPVLVSEADVAKILQAKAAVFAGMRILMEKQKKDWADLDQMILAGGFAKYLDPAHAIAIGLLPEIPPERIETIGNGSLAGAYCALMDSKTIRKMNTISEAIDVIELNRVPEFHLYYIEALCLPV